MKNDRKQPRKRSKRILAGMYGGMIFAAAIGFLGVPRIYATEEYGSNPSLAEPDKNGPIPTINVAEAAGWPEGKTPVAAQGFEVHAFAKDLRHPRWLYVLPNGDVLVAETDAPSKPDDGRGVKGFFMKMFMEKAGSGTKSANTITLLRDVDGDGIPETSSLFLSGLNSPFGMALVDNNFYVANTDAVVRFPYEEGALQITEPGEILASLPAGPLNHHWTKNIVTGPSNSYLYVSVGSNSNIGENGMKKEEGRAAIHQIDLRNGASEIFASGLRNPVGMDWNPQTNELWTVVNERDELGDELVPDYMTSVKSGGFYGWPYSYFGQHVDSRVTPQNPEMVARAMTPDYALGAHTASLGLVFYDSELFPLRYRNGAFIGQHGSWNRSEPVGYKVIFVPFVEGRPFGNPEDILTGFREGDKAYGRPVGVAIDKTGALLVADDVGNTIWRVIPQSSGL